MLSVFKRLFGGGHTTAAPTKAPAGEPVLHQGCTIIPAPQREGSQYRLAGTISKEIDGTVHTHEFIRADLVSSLDEANKLMVTKAKTCIDQQGDSLFFPPPPRRPQ